jgi:hypothetical protein
VTKSQTAPRSAWGLSTICMLGALCGFALGRYDAQRRGLLIGDVGWWIFWELDSKVHWIDKDVQWAWSYTWHPQALAICGLLGALLGAVVSFCVGRFFLRMSGMAERNKAN